MQPNLPPKYAQIKRRRRIQIMILALSCFAIATSLVLFAFKGNIAFFYSPAELLATPPSKNKLIRLGGLVAYNSLLQTENGNVQFKVTDFKQWVQVEYAGILPDLFREGQGVVVLGKLHSNHIFKANEVLAKHDENYMPAETVEAMKRAGIWRKSTSEN